MAANGKPSQWSKTWTFYEGDWHEGNIGIYGPRTHAAWLGSRCSTARARSRGVTPDLDLHCARTNDSAPKLFLKPLVPKETWLGLVADGMKRFDKDTPLYIRPMYWAEHGGTLTGVSADPESTRWCLCLYETAMPPASAGLSITLSPFRRPMIECMPVDAKAGCLYEQWARAVRGGLARLRQLPPVRHARQCRRTWHHERVLRQGWRCLHTGRERHVPQRHHASAQHQAAARCRCERHRGLFFAIPTSRARTKCSRAATIRS